MQPEKGQLNQGDRGHRVMVQALFMAFGTLTSRVLGLVRESLLAALFGRTVTDAWYVAFRLPNIFRRLFGEGSLSVSFIPVFVETKVGPGGELETRKLVNGFYTLFFLVLAVLTALGVIFPEALLRFLLDEQYLAMPGKFELTVMMSRVMFAYIFLVCTYAYFMAILQGLGRFGWAALAPTFFNVCMILSTLIPSEWTAWPGQALAWGVIVGGMVQAAVLIPSLRSQGYFPKFSTQIWSPAIRKVFVSMGPGLLGMGLLQITTLVNLRFASQLGEGPISYINLADRLLELPLALVSVSIGSALLPTLSKMWAEKNARQMVETSNYYLRLNLYVCLPAAIGLYVLAEPIVELLFQRGRFDLSESLQTAGVVRVYSFLVVTTSLVRVFLPSYYAIKNTWFPALVSALCLVLHVFLAPVLMERYGLYGLNASTAVSSGLNILFLASFLAVWVSEPYGWWRVFKSTFKFLMAGALMAALLMLYWPLREFLGSSFIAKVASLFVVISAGSALYGLASGWLRIEEYLVTRDQIAGKIRARLERKRATK